MASGAPSCLLGIRIKRNKIFNNPRPQNGKSLLGKEVFWGWRTWKNNCCDYSTKSPGLFHDKPERHFAEGK